MTFFLLLKKIILPTFQARSIQCLHQIQFTIKTENNHTLPFLDILIEIFVNNVYTLKYSVYRKNTSSWHYPNFNSNNPLSHNIAVVMSLYNKALRFCNSEVSYNNERNKMITDLRLNDYPRRWCYSVLSELSKKLDKYPMPYQRANPTGTIFYYANTFEKISAIFKSVDNRIAYVHLNPIINFLGNYYKHRYSKFDVRGVVFRVPSKGYMSVFDLILPEWLRLRKYLNCLYSEYVISPY